MIAMTFRVDEVRALMHRPVMTDVPGHRFRARTGSESVGPATLAHGYTVDLSTADFKDGFPELVLDLDKEISPAAQSAWVVGFMLLDKAVDAAQHGLFAAHLLRGRSFDDLMTTFGGP